MSDGLGSVVYNYNNLAQLTSETRSFNGVGTPFMLTYGYNLAGELSGVTNPWGAQVGYGYDKAGRLQNVSGAGYAGVSNYAAGLSYRAFGAIKGMNYGNGRSLSTGYDGRLRPTTWNVANVQGYNYTYNNTYLQETTGRVSYAQNIQDPTLDRSYEYDHVGRLAISHSGTEARAHAVWGQWGTLDGPYSQGYDYDPWGNVTHKYGWGGEVHGDGPENDGNLYYSYAGNRRNGSTYDAAGNLKSGGNQSFSYDATGQQTYAASQGSGGSAPVFTNNPLVVGQTTIKAVHVTELRTAINQVRAGVGLAGYSWQYSATTNDYINANPILEMRTALDQALGPPPAPGYAAGLAQGQPILKVHIQELRDRVLTAWNSGSGGIDIRWLVADQLGTPRMIFDQTSSLAGVKRHDYLPFGEELFAGQGGRTTAQGYVGDTLRQKFTLKERDNETGLDYFGARSLCLVASGPFPSDTRPVVAHPPTKLVLTSLLISAANAVGFACVD